MDFGCTGLRHPGPIRGAWHDRFLPVGDAVTAEELLKLCHAYLRGTEINDPARCQPVDRDTLARQINLFLNQSCSAQPAGPRPAPLKQEQPETV
jgi:hypothetical protein